MPITGIQTTIYRLSNDWTHEKIANEAQVLTNTLDNEFIQLSNVRAHINVNISYLAELLNLAAFPFYQIWMTGAFESALHPSGLEYINLGTTIGGYVPFRIISSIRRINFVKNGEESDWCLNVARQDIAKLTSLASGQNLQYYQSILWNWSGSDLLFYVGDDIESANRDITDVSYDITSQVINIFATRNPLLDDMLAENVSTTYRQPIDLPDKYVKLLLGLVQKSILNQLSREPPAQLEAEINQGIAMINQEIAQEIQHSQQIIDKYAYGNLSQRQGQI